jgi:hypothetical protein
VEEFVVTPSSEEVAFFRENGYLVVERITTDEELDWLTELYEEIFAAKEPELRPLDRSGRRDPSIAGTLTQYFHPEIRFGELLKSTYFANAKRYAAALLGEDVSNLTVWSHMIREAPGAPEVPPHQDEAFWPPDYEYRSVAAWMPLHDVSVEMGSMQFLPGSHRGGVLTHRHYDHPSQNLLTVDEPVDAAAFVPCPLKRGGCTFHHPSTVHQTAVNTTDSPRLAYPLTVQTVPSRRPVPRSTPWLDEFVAANGGHRQTTYVADAQVLPLPV